MSGYREYVDRLIPIGEVFAVPINHEVNDLDDAAVGEDGHDLNVVATRKMMAPVSLSNFFYPTDYETRRKLIELAWCNDPVSYAEETEWGEETIKKMREPVYQGWRVYITPANLKKLVENA